MNQLSMEFISEMVCSKAPANLVDKGSTTVIHAIFQFFPCQVSNNTNVWFLSTDRSIDDEEGDSLDMSFATHGYRAHLTAQRHERCPYDLPPVVPYWLPRSLSILFTSVCDLRLFSMVKMLDLKQTFRYLVIQSN